jgi:Na+/proline symporter
MEVIGGLTAICLGLIVVLFLAVLAMALVRDDSDSVATIATSAFTLVGTLVGAFFGIKIGTDQAKTAQAQTELAYTTCARRQRRRRPSPPASIAIRLNRR